MESCSLIQIVVQSLVVAIIVFGIGVKIERRLTKIETDVKWLKSFIEINRRGEK